jgi:hypothetical protein
VKSPCEGLNSAEAVTAHRGNEVIPHVVSDAVVDSAAAARNRGSTITLEVDEAITNDGSATLSVCHSRVQGDDVVPDGAWPFDHLPVSAITQVTSAVKHSAKSSSLPINPK